MLVDDLRTDVFTICIVNRDSNGIKRIVSELHKFSCLVVPRHLVNDAKKLPDTHKRGVYYLFDDKILPKKAYVGQTTQGVNRLLDHDDKKDWWKYAVMFLVDDNDISKDTIDGLEYYGFDGLSKIDVEKDNKNQIPYSPDAYQDDVVRELNNEILYLLAVAGFQLSDQHDEDLLYSNMRGIPARYRLDENAGKITVLEGSNIDLDNEKRSNKAKKKLETELENIKIDEESHVGTLLKDIVLDVKVTKADDYGNKFRPNLAINFVYGGDHDAWKELHNIEGVSLSELKRVNPIDAAE